MGDKFDLDSEFNEDYKCTLDELINDCDMTPENGRKNRLCHCTNGNHRFR
ncbi:MAG: hypothetical protein PUH54_00850 [Oscillospiraceae bacterium]|nr:hypothetical protein [Oscillospiraceae bacterium]